MDLTHDGITQPITEWAADYGIPCRTIRSRLAKKWSVERAITEPMKVQGGMKLVRADMIDNAPPPRIVKRIAYQGETLTLTELAERTGIKRVTIESRLKGGWTVEQAVSGQRPKRPRVRRGFSTGRHPRTITLNGETLTISGWAERLGVSKPALHVRLSKGWSLERTLTTPKLRKTGPKAANDDRRLEATA